MTISSQLLKKLPKKDIKEPQDDYQMGRRIGFNHCISISKKKISKVELDYNNILRILVNIIVEDFGETPEILKEAAKALTQADLIKEGK